MSIRLAEFAPPSHKGGVTATLQRPWQILRYIYERSSCRHPLLCQPHDNLLSLHHLRYQQLSASAQLHSVMPKRKGRAECGPNGSAYPITHFDAAMDLLVSETYNRIFTLAKMYEKAGGLHLDQKQCLGRWQEAVRRWECVQSLSGLSWGTDSKGKGKDVGGVEAVELEWASSTTRDGRGTAWEWNSVVLGHAGSVITKELDASEEAEWRRWTPQVGDVVLVDLADGSTWPGKVSD